MPGLGYANSMPKNNKNIPVNSMDDPPGQGIAIDRISIKNSDFKRAYQYEEATRSHRDEGHTIHIVEKGSILIEIDFQKYKITAPAVVYMHPNQVHRILEFHNMTVCSLAISNEQLHPEQLASLEEIAPAPPLGLTQEAYAGIFNTFMLCLNFATQKGGRLHHLVIRDSCNAFVALVTSAFLGREQASGKLSRSGFIARSFKQLVEKEYRSTKRPAAYAGQLNISTHYLNECIKSSTGLSVSQYLQDRIILEAKRMLYHTDKSVKEIAFDLGYEDYPYFSRLFTKATGMSALAFRNKRHD
jgi:AraC-like DNA-binding protein/mannose-6-phosphate isomerase-like protein (cupin superfamily)